MKTKLAKQSEPRKMEKHSIRIRYATPSDNLLLSELGARTFYDTYAADNTPGNMAAFLRASYHPEKQSAELADPSSVFLIAEIAGTAVGFARLRTGNPSEGITGKHPIEIARLYAYSEWIGQGVGASLIQACLDEAGKQGCDTIWLGVWERNHRAFSFYRKWGFIKKGFHIFQVGEDMQKDTLMQRPVGA